MSKIDYSDSRYTIREDLIASHRQVWDKLSGAGTG